ncbi:MAG: hypothetical protein LBS25_10220 [Candidatus Symbiothrix sp.]|nr:hypothetical protein [Candidatus Symbiothrix sp.]
MDEKAKLTPKEFFNLFSGFEIEALYVVISDLAKSDLQNIISYISASESITTAKYVARGILSEMKK